MTARSPLDRRSALLVSATVGLATIALRATGWLQPLEWMMGDRFFQWRPKPDPSTVVTIVEINEADLREIGRYPVTDGTVAEALNIIQQHRPRRIGLDLYRDLPIEPGQKALQKALQVDNLIGVDKAVVPKIDPHPELATRKQVGFADQVIDSDGKVRRALLSIRGEQQKTQYSLGLRLALDYLDQEKITPLPEGKGLRLGQGLILPLAGDDGSYVRTQTGGYQIILNFYGTQRQFPTIPLRYILAQQFDPALLRDRIVLLGHTAESVNDLFQTPYSRNGDRFMPGVIVHANTIEQLIGAAQGKHQLLRSLPEPGEYLWILLWGGLGCAIVWQLGRRSLLANALSVVGASLGVVGLGYGLFLAGWLLPVVPAILALLGGATILPALAQKQWERQELKQLLTLLLTTGEEPADDPVQQLAIELLKQSEGSEQQSFIDAWVNQSRP